MAESRRSSRREVADAVKEEKATPRSAKAASASTVTTAGAADAKGSPTLDATMDDATPSAAASTTAATTSGAATSAAPAGATASNKRGKTSIRANDLKRKKLVPRCTSPSHFLMEEAGAAGSSAAAAAPSPLPSALSADPNAPSATKLSESGARIDAYLHSIGAMYYRNSMSLGKDTNGPAEVWVSSDYDKLEYPTLDLLISPLRKPNVLDNWCPREIALFESGICSVGKDFHAISNLIATKTCKECVDFYYAWKKSSHYAMWKNFGKPSKKPHANKEEQWKAIREQMKTTPPPASTMPHQQQPNSTLAPPAAAAVKKEA